MHARQVALRVGRHATIILQKQKLGIGYEYPTSELASHPSRPSGRSTGSNAILAFRLSIKSTFQE